MDPTPKEAAEMAKQQKGGKKGNKKGKTLHLSEFQTLGSSGSSSWADEVEDLPSGPAALPSGPSRGDSYSDSPRGRDDDFRPVGRRSNFGEDRPPREYTRREDSRDHEDRPQGRPRGELIERRGYQIDTSSRPHKTNYPTAPPYKLYLGNLSFRANEDDIRDLFKGSKVLDIKIPQAEGRSRGFAYVEVDSIEAIHLALEMNGALVQDRAVIIDLADVPTDQRDWRQRESTDGQSGSRGFSKDDRRSNFDNRSPREPREFNRDSREPREFNRDSREPREFNRDSRDSRDSREPRQPRFSKSDDVNDWRTRSDNPAPLVQREPREPREPREFNNREPREPREPREFNREPREFNREPREDRPRFNRGDQGTEGGAQGASERPKLELRPKSEGASTPTQSKPKASPFGEAKPRDEAEMQRRFEERKKQKEAEKPSTPTATN